MSTWNIIANIVAGLLVAVPVVIALVKKTADLVRLENWTQIVGIVAGYMKQAENLMEHGATKKEWVLGMLHQSAEIAAYKLDEAAWERISDMIDELCKMAKTVNSEKVINEDTVA